LRRKNVSDIRSNSVTPINYFMEERFKYIAPFQKLEICSGSNLKFLIDFKPDTIIHLAEQPSAPWSMKSLENNIATHRNNVEGTLTLLYMMKDLMPNTHLIKIGTMGEYGVLSEYGNATIPEGYFEYQGCTLPFPKQPGSFYHCTKVHETTNINLACKIWGLKVTDIMQGVVYGVETEQTKNYGEYTRLDVDQYFGTAINRFCAQAVCGIPITLYGKGRQKRGFLSLKDSIQCLEIMVRNPPKEGQHQIINQFEEVLCLEDIAEIIKSIVLIAEVQHIDNPRCELEDHIYLAEHSKLKEFGYKPSSTLKEEMRSIIGIVDKFKDAICTSSIMPTVNWRK